jgi:pimeloyl-ACP methyl ester carboxylesterase
MQQSAACTHCLTGAASPADREVMTDPEVHRRIAASFTEAFSSGAEGPAQELGLFARHWDIDPARVRVAVQLWHGEADRTVPVAMGRRLAQRLPDCDARFLAGEGHFSLVVRYLDRILADLIRSAA